MVQLSDYTVNALAPLPLHSSRQHGRFIPHLEQSHLGYLSTTHFRRTTLLAVGNGKSGAKKFENVRVNAQSSMSVLTSPGTATAGRNVFESFTPQYAQNEAIPGAAAANEIKSNAEAQQSSAYMSTKIVKLLSDDDGEEDDETPDFSEAAANEVADKSYSRISEQAKFKANAAVMKKDLFGEPTDLGLEYFDDRGDGKRKRTSKVRASVKETGNDTIRSYVKSMGAHELLPKESEELLGRHIQLLVKWEGVRQELEESLLQAPTFAQWADALKVTVPELKKQIRRSQRAKAALIEANLRLVVTVARQTVKRGRSEINFQDACQEGIIGLTRACEKFDPEKGFRFSTYAVWWIKRSVHSNINQQSRNVRLPANAMKKINDIRITERLLMNELGRRPKDDDIAEKLGMKLEQVAFYKKVALDAGSLDKQLVGKVGKGSNASGGNSNGKTIASLVKDSGPTPTEIANKENFQDDVRRLIKTLSPKEQAVIRLRFGLDDGTPRTLQYIGDKFSVSKEIIRKIEAKALLKLRQPYRNQSVKCYVSDI